METRTIEVSQSQYDAMKGVDYQQEVKKVYSDAWCFIPHPWRTQVYRIFVPRSRFFLIALFTEKCVGIGDTSELAWKDAYDNLKIRN